MTEITLYQQERYLNISQLREDRRALLLDCVQDAMRGSVPKEEIEHLMENAISSKVCDLEDKVKIHYVDRERDLSKVNSLELSRFMFGYSRAHFKPLLEALDAGDFELASALTPSKYRLIGFREVKQKETFNEYGIGWAGQFADIEVPAGVYPVFAAEFARHEAKNCYMNKLKDFNGLFVWMEGMCIAASDTLHNEFPFPRVLISSPYCHSVAKAILDGQSNIRLIAPFKAEEEHFTYDGKDCVSRKIVDTSLPLFLKDNPMKLRTAAEREAVFSRQAPLQEQIQAAEEKKTDSPGKKEPLIDHIR